MPPPHFYLSPLEAPPGHLSPQVSLFHLQDPGTLGVTPAWKRHTEMSSSFNTFFSPADIRLDCLNCTELRLHQPRQACLNGSTIPQDQKQDLPHSVLSVLLVVNDHPDFTRRLSGGLKRREADSYPVKTSQLRSIATSSTALLSPTRCPNVPSAPPAP